MMANVNKYTIIRTVVLIVALINQVLSDTGKSIIPIAEDELETFLTTCFTVVSAIWAWWKNNSFTEEAIAADEMLESMKEMR